VARAALEAGELKLARASAEALIRQEPRERAFLLMADIEEAETGEQGRVREWLARALRAPRDAAWVADGYVSERWAPFSPVTGRIDAFEWKVPVERVAQMIEQERDEILPAKEALPAPKEITPDLPVEKVVEVDIAPEPAEKPAPQQPAPAQPAAPAPAPKAETRPTQPDGRSVKPAEAVEKPATRTAPRAKPVPSEAKVPAEAVMFVGPPDDPGVDTDDDVPGANGRSRLF
jgi:HemY protein